MWEGAAQIPTHLHLLASFSLFWETTGRLSPSWYLSTFKVVWTQVGHVPQPHSDSSLPMVWPLSLLWQSSLPTPTKGGPQLLCPSTPGHTSHPIQSANSRALGTVALRRMMETWSGSMISTSSHTTPRWAEREDKSWAAQRAVLLLGLHWRAKAERFRVCGGSCRASPELLVWGPTDPCSLPQHH